MNALTRPLPPRVRARLEGDPAAQDVTITRAASTTSCRLGGPAWCDVDHLGETPIIFTHAGHVAAVQVAPGPHGGPSAVLVDVEETEAGGPTVVLDGAGEWHQCLSVAEAARLGVAVLTAVVVARGGLDEAARESFTALMGGVR